MSNLNINNSNISFFCSGDGCELYDIYSPMIDDESLIASNPDNFDEMAEQEKQNLIQRRQLLIETIANIRSEEKRKRLNRIVSQQNGIILVCPNCKRVYDSTSISLQEKTYSSDRNIMPFRKPTKHRVVSDDKESVERATTNDFESENFFFGGASRQVFFSEEKEEDNKLKPPKENNTLFKYRAEQHSIANIKHASTELKALIERFGKENINIQVQLADTEYKG